MMSLADLSALAASVESARVAFNTALTNAQAAGIAVTAHVNYSGPTPVAGAPASATSLVASCSLPLPVTE